MATLRTLSTTVALLVLGLVAGCSSGSSNPAEAETGTKTVTVTSRAQPADTETISVSEPVPVTKLGPAPPSHRIAFGHITSLARSGKGFELRFDPAEFTSGVTASAAALEDTGSSDVPNDNYVVDETHRLYTYLVRADAHVIVLADDPDGTLITVAQLAKLVQGKEPLGHPLFEPLETGFWILFDVDRVRSLDQQYVP
jgi:hypothetical protein